MASAIRPVALSLALLAALPLIAGCNTIHGAGQDIEAAGEGVQSLSQETERALEGDR